MELHKVRLRYATEQSFLHILNHFKQGLYDNWRGEYLLKYNRNKNKNTCFRFFVNTCMNVICPMKCGWSNVLDSFSNIYPSVIHLKTKLSEK